MALLLALYYKREPEESQWWSREDDGVHVRMMVLGMLAMVLNGDDDDNEIDNVALMHNAILLEQQLLSWLFIYWKLLPYGHLYHLLSINWFNL